MPAAKLSHSFYARHAVEVASDLLGKLLVRSLPEGVLKGRIVETEAYTGTSDPGSHAYRGPTPRNQVMFGPAGYVYVYLSYGMHHCMNVVTDDPGVAGAVLLRALEPVAGLDIMEPERPPTSGVAEWTGQDLSGVPHFARPERRGSRVVKHVDRARWVPGGSGARRYTGGNNSRSGPPIPIFG